MIKNTKILTSEFSKELLLKYFEDRGAVGHNIKSFDDFVKYGMQRVVDEVDDMVLDILPERVKELKIKFSKIWIDKPYVREADGTRRRITPMEARLRNITYSAPIMLEMIMIKDGVETEKTAIQVGDIPVMLRSKNCILKNKTDEELIGMNENPQDPGGYFIINGTERVVVIIEDLAANRVFVEHKKTGTYPYIAKLFSEDGKYRIPHTLEKGKNGVIYLSFTRLKKVPFAIVMRALGISKDKDMMDIISGGDPELQSDIYINLFETGDVNTPKKALAYLGKKLGVTHSEEKAIERAEDMLDKFFIAHVGQNKKDRLNKANYLGRTIRKMLLVSYNRLDPDDKDHYANKRLKLPGDLLETLFRFSFRMLLGDMKYNFERLVKRGRVPSLASITRSQLLTSRLNSALATGEWIGNRSGVSQQLDRVNHLSMLSHLRRVVSLLTSSRENFEARDLHPTHWGKLCVSETPEGPPVGLRKNLAVTCEISTECPMLENQIVKLMGKMGLKKLVNGGCDVYLNGKIIGTTEEGMKFADIVKEARRTGKIPSELNVVYYENENIVIANTEKGRARRPLIVVKNGKSSLTKEIADKLIKREISYNKLIDLGVIEYLDSEEEENTLIAMDESKITKEHTHLEIGEQIIFGTMASLVPYPEHNLSVRVMIGAKTMKQGIGTYAKNAIMRFDTDASLLHSPQRPIVQTYLQNISEYSSHPIGQNLVIAIMSWNGYNMDDAVVFNKASVQRGMYRSTYFRPYKVEELRYPGGQLDNIEIPDKEVRGYKTEEVYRYLSQDGIIYPEAEVSAGDVLVGRTSPPRFLASLEEFKVGVEDRRETSESVRFREKGVIDSVMVTEANSGNKVITVKLRNQRIPELGDKFSSRHGQKGVIGMLVPPENLPFSSSGIVPDLVFNPHSIPSRMTVGQLIEIIGGKVGALSGEYIDGSAFSSQSEFELRENLKNLGFRENGLETMYDGATGRMYTARIFVGNAFYLKLKHMVADKIHSRSRGPIQLLTRQPTEGKSKEGGLKLGEMENHCFVAHGAALTLKERFDSDKAVIPVCKNCGLVAIYNRFRRKGICSVCGDSSDISFIEMSYAFKLLLDELKSLGIYPKLLIGAKS